MDAIGQRMASNRLKLNPWRRNLLWCTTRRRQHQLNRSSLVFGGATVQPSSTVRDHGVILDSEVSFRLSNCKMDRHVQNILSQRTGCESNPQPLGYESDTLPLDHYIINVKTFQFKHGVRALNHTYKTAQIIVWRWLIDHSKEILFRWPGLRHLMNHPTINNFGQVDVVKLLGILLSIVVLMEKLVMYLTCVVSGSICCKCSVNRVCPGNNFTLYFWHWLYPDYVMPCQLGVVFWVLSKLDRLTLFWKEFIRVSFSANYTVFQKTCDYVFDDNLN